MPATEKFFDETTDQSQVKAAIVSKYFWAWAKVIIPTAKKHDGRIAYIDLFAGPGRYKDGTISTPLLILQKAIEDVDLRQMLVTIFNDKDSTNTQSLQKAMAELPGLGTLKYAPQVRTQEVGTEIVRMFEQMTLVPTFFFVDPWGYKGLSLRLVNAVLKDWGCDCIFFFNYNRINMGLGNQAVQDHMDALFGKERADELRIELVPLPPPAREMAIVEELCHALRDVGGTFVLPFGFKNDAGGRTSHHLIFVSKHFKGYEIMKTIMSQESSSANQGVASFAYSPATSRQPLLFELTRPLDDLAEMLLDEFAGKNLAMNAVYEVHNVGRPYVKKNYKDVLRQLESSGSIKAQPSADQRQVRKGLVTFADDVVVSFPPRRGKHGH